MEPDQTILERLNLAAGGYVLAVSSINPHKNFKLVVASMALLKDSGLSLVIAGGVNPRVFSGSGADFPANVKYAGYVSDGELKALYSGALCFVYPSLYEGFGLPPLEAMACGCPVVVSDRASLPEVCGAAAVYVDPGSAAGLVAAIEKIHSDPEVRRAMAETGRARAALFTWRRTAESLLAVCLEAAGFKAVK
ncbi:MAG: glycosyltransferase family 1 protein [Elusimicrobiota bacterium]